MISAYASFVNRSEILHRFSAKIRSVPDYEDIICHADENSFVIVMSDGSEYKMTAAEFAKRIKGTPGYKGGNVRLISCKAGRGKLAQELADLLKVKVMAATENVNVSYRGELFVSNDRQKAMMYFMGQKIDPTGTWIVFVPQDGRGE